MSNLGGIKNLDRLLGKLGNIADTPIMRAGLNRACRHVERDAKINCTGFKNPTGNLKASITHEIVTGFRKMYGIVGTPVEYAPYVELGTGLYAVNGNGRKTPWPVPNPNAGKEGEPDVIWTVGQHPEPFLQPALDKNRGAIVEDLREAANRQLLSIAGGGANG